MPRQNITFKTSDGIQLHGWFYTLDHSQVAPCIIMTHGFSALKEHSLAKFADVFVKAGLCVLVYDNRNFGESEGEPRFEVNPELQVQDLLSAISFLATKPEVDKNKIGLWGTSFSGGNVLVAAASDDRVRCVVAQVPFVKGHHDYLKLKRPDLWEIIQRKYAADAKARATGKLPGMTPVVTADPEKSAVMKEPEAYQYFTQLPQWQNQVTLHSVELSGNSAPINVVSKIKIPVLFIIADNDTICLTSLALSAYEKLTTLKKCIRVKGHHFSVYDEHFELCAKEAGKWFKENL